jgi:CRISPR system Cascade subunit CasC
MFLQIHYLTAYHASLLNRDDAGLAKRIPFGGVERLRISSQCQKRHWREWLMTRLELPFGIRSRHFFSREIKRRLIEEAGVEESLAHTLVFDVASSLLTAARGKDALHKDTLDMEQPVLFGKPEADYLITLLKEAAREGDPKAASECVKEQLKQGRSNFRALMRQAGIQDPLTGVEAALFGRFVTSDILSRVDAPVHVAHAFTVHALDTEVDFFTVVDDLARAEETGAAHANDAELGSGIFYGYVAVDIPLLVSNLTGADIRRWRAQEPDMSTYVLRALVRAIAQVSPGAKLGATAPHAWADYVVLENGDAQPRSLANAFLQPVRLNGARHPMEQAAGALAAHLDNLQKMYGDTGERRYVATTQQWLRTTEPVLPLDEAVDCCLTDIFKGEQS